MLLLYWEIGKLIAERQATEGWGAKVIQKLSDDLREEIPDTSSFSVRNLKYMLKLYKTYPDFEFVQRIVAQIPWGLKVVEFEPEFAGKMNFYLNALDTFAKLPEENASIGIILCKNKKRTKVEFALRGIDKPMGVAEYYLTKKLPKHLQGKLPTARQIEEKIKNIENNGS